jgi:hypothetical protein
MDAALRVHHPEESKPGPRAGVEGLDGALTGGGGAGATTGAGAAGAGAGAGAAGAGVGVAATSTGAAGVDGLAGFGGCGALRIEGIVTARSDGAPLGGFTVVMSETAARTAAADPSAAAGVTWPRTACAEMPTTNAPAAPAAAIQRSA